MRGAPARPRPPPWPADRFPRKTYPPFFFNDTATTEIYTLSLHDALPISLFSIAILFVILAYFLKFKQSGWSMLDRKSTRLNSSHMSISYAVFCLKKKKHVPNAPSIKDHETYVHQQELGTPEQHTTLP